MEVRGTVNTQCSVVASKTRPEIEILHSDPDPHGNLASTFDSSSLCATVLVNPAVYSVLCVLL